MVLDGELLRHDNSVGLREEAERIGDGILIALQRIIPHRPVAPHIDAQDEHIPLGGIGCPHHRFDHRDGGAHALGCAHSVNHVFRQASRHSRHLEDGIPGDLADGVAQGF